MLPPRELDRGGRPLRGTFTEDMFEEAEDLDHPYFAPSTIRRGWCARTVAAVSHLPPGCGRRPLADRRDRQDRRALLLLQDAAETARVLAALGANGRRRGRLHQYGAGRFRRRCAGVPCASQGQGRPLLPPDGPAAHARRRGAEHLRARGARTADDDAGRREGVRHGAGRPARGAGRNKPIRTSSTRCCPIGRCRAPYSSS